jgi:hypothetical protein
MFPSVDFLLGGLRREFMRNAFLWFFMERWVNIFAVPCRRVVQLLLPASRLL